MDSLVVPSTETSSASATGMYKFIHIFYMLLQFIKVLIKKYTIIMLKVLHRADYVLVNNLDMCCRLPNEAKSLYL